MKFNINSEDFELDLYSKIIDYFQNKKVTKEEIEIWKNRSIIELMKYFKRTKNRELVTNALILILSLFEDTPPDLYHNRGVKINCISDKDKKYFIEDLKAEFLPN